MKLWKQRCRELAKENLQLKASCKLRPEGAGVGRRVLSELPQPNLVQGGNSPSNGADPLSWQARLVSMFSLWHPLDARSLHGVTQHMFNQ